MKKLRVKLPQDLLDRVRGYSLLHRVSLTRFVDAALSSWSEANGSADEQWMILAALPVSPDAWKAARNAAKLSGVSLQGAIRQALERHLESLMSAPEPKKASSTAHTIPHPSDAIPENGTPSNEVTCYRCGNHWTPRKAEPSYCPRCRASDWNDAWKCKTCGQWFAKKLQRGEFCMRHQPIPGDPPAPPVRFVAPAELDEPRECAQCETLYTSAANYPCCSEECLTAWKEENQ